MSKPQVRHLFLESKIIYYGRQILRYTLSTHRTTTNTGTLGESCKKFEKILSTVFESKQTACFVTKGGAETQFQVSRRKGGRGSIPLPNDNSEQKGMIEWKLNNSTMQKIYSKNNQRKLFTNSTRCGDLEIKERHGNLNKDTKTAKEKETLNLKGEKFEQKGGDALKIENSKNQKLFTTNKSTPINQHSKNKTLKMYLKAKLHRNGINKIQINRQIISNSNLAPNLLLENPNNQIVNTSDPKLPPILLLELSCGFKLYKTIHIFVLHKHLSTFTFSKMVKGSQSPKSKDSARNKAEKAIAKEKKASQVKEHLQAEAAKAKGNGKELLQIEPATPIVIGKNQTQSKSKINGIEDPPQEQHALSVDVSMEEKSSTKTQFEVTEVPSPAKKAKTSESNSPRRPNTRSMGNPYGATPNSKTEAEKMTPGPFSKATPDRWDEEEEQRLLEMAEEIKLRKAARALQAEREKNAESEKDKENQVGVERLSAAIADSEIANEALRREHEHREATRMQEMLLFKKRMDQERIAKIPQEEREMIRTSIEVIRISKILAEKEKNGESIKESDLQLKEQALINWRKATAERDRIVLEAQNKDIVSKEMPKSVSEKSTKSTTAPAKETTTSSSVLESNEQQKSKILMEGTPKVVRISNEELINAKAKAAILEHEKKLIIWDENTPNEEELREAKLAAAKERKQETTFTKSNTNLNTNKKRNEIVTIPDSSDEEDIKMDEHIAAMSDVPSDSDSITTGNESDSHSSKNNNEPQTFRQHDSMEGPATGSYSPAYRKQAETQNYSRSRFENRNSYDPKPMEKTLKQYSKFGKSTPVTKVVVDAPSKEDLDFISLDYKLEELSESFINPDNFEVTITRKNPDDTNDVIISYLRTKYGLKIDTTRTKITGHKITITCETPEERLKLKDIDDEIIKFEYMGGRFKFEHSYNIRDQHNEFKYFSEDSDIIIQHLKSRKIGDDYLSCNGGVLKVSFETEGGWLNESIAPCRWVTIVKAEKKYVYELRRINQYMTTTNKNWRQYSIEGLDSDTNSDYNILRIVKSLTRIIQNALSDKDELKKFQIERATIIPLTFKSKQNQIGKFAGFWVKGKEIIALVDKLVRVAILKERAGKPDAIAIKEAQNPDK